MARRTPRALPAGLDQRWVPEHVAIVMDGNGRWANARGLPRRAGHEAGEAVLFDTVEGAIDVGLGWLTVYAFSTENWRRPPSEVRFLMNFNESLLVRRSHEMHERGVRIRFIGRRDRVPRRVLRRMQESEELTRDDRRLNLTIALDYGSRDELVRAVRRLVADALAGRGPDRIGARTISGYLDEPEMPDVDLLIRTAGERRVSNFLLWQAHYAELYFTPLTWPEFGRAALFDALQDYRHRRRRFGAVPGQPGSGAAGAAPDEASDPAGPDVREERDDGAATRAAGAGDPPAARPGTARNP